MEFRHLRYFLVLSEELHFGRAARRLAISQPPLSLNIQQLEASIGARLFTRSSKEVRLTAAGEAFVPRARAVLDQAAGAARLARDVSQGLIGELQVGFVGAMLFRGLPQWLTTFQARRPEVRVVLQELNSQEQLRQLLRGQLDVGFVHTHRIPPELQHTLVAEEAFVCCLPASHPLARRRHIALASLKDEPFVLFARAVSPDYHERILGICADAGFTPDVRHEVRHWLSVVSLVAQGMGVALVPNALRRSGMEGAVFVRLGASTASSLAYCAWKPREDDPALSTFLEVVAVGAKAAAGTR